MLLSGHFLGPVVLLGISLTSEDDAAFFRAAVRLSQRVGSWPMAILIRLLPLMAKVRQDNCIAQAGPDRGPEAEPGRRFGTSER